MKYYMQLKDSYGLSKEILLADIPDPKLMGIAYPPPIYKLYEETKKYIAYESFPVINRIGKYKKFKYSGVYLTEKDKTTYIYTEDIIQPELGFVYAPYIPYKVMDKEPIGITDTVRSKCWSDYPTTWSAESFVLPLTNNKLPDPTPIVWSCF